MEIRFRPCVFERDHKAYVKFLIQHYDQLQLPYSFAMLLSFISSPLMYGKAMIAVDKELDEIVGAAGFVYGTGIHDYADRHVCQLEVVFLLEAYRGTALFSRFLQAIAEMMKAGEPDVRFVQFWARAKQERQQRLFSKFLALPGATSQTMANGLTQYVAPFHPFEAYCLRLADKEVK